MSYKPDIAAIFEAAFGISVPVYVAPVYEPNASRVPTGGFYDGSAKEAAVATLPFTGVEVVDQPTGSRMSMYGHPLMFPFLFIGDTYKKFDTDGRLVEYRLPDFDLPAATLVDFSRSKRIVYTETAGEGDVKELYGFGDWDISIRGVCLLDNNHQQAKTAEEQKKKLLEWEQVAGHVRVAGELFKEKNIHALVIESFRVSQLSGIPGMIPFEMSCKSDFPYELTQKPDTFPQSNTNPQ